MGVSDNLPITTGVGGTIASDEVVHGGVPAQAQIVKIFDATADSVNRWIIDNAGNGQVINAGLKGPGATNGLLLNTGSWIEAKVGVAVLVARKSLILQNLSDVAVNWTFDNSRTLAQTHQIPSGQSATLDIGTTPVYVQAASGSGKSLIVSEMS